MTNTFKKLCAGVYGMQSDQEYKHGDITTIETKHGKEVEVTVWKKIRPNTYSIIRNDGINNKQRLLNKAEQRQGWAEKAEERANKDNLTQNEHDFLKLGEPVKIGHHSQRKHENLLKRLDNQMRRGYEESKKAEYHKDKAEACERRAENSLFIDTPDCLEDIKKAYEEQKEAHEAMKASESYNTCLLANSRAKLKRLEVKMKNAITLWEVSND